MLWTLIVLFNRLLKPFAFKRRFFLFHIKMSLLNKVINVEILKSIHLKTGYDIMKINLMKEEEAEYESIF